MLSEKEKAFIEYWEQNRENLNGFLSKISRGLPVALLSTVPIILSVIAVYFFSPEWYTKISNVGAGTQSMILLAVFIATLFSSYFRMQFKWEMNEQSYQELKNREQKAGAANPNSFHS